MAENIIALKDLKRPEELVAPQEDGTYEQYKKDGVYGYRLLPNGKKDKNFAKITYNTGDVYEGNLKHGKYNGIGKYYWKDGGIYEGNFSKGVLSGQGKYTAANGDIFEGNFKNDNYDGQGKYTWQDGSNFEGLFKDGKLIEGKYTDISGNVYNCKFSYKRNGESKNSVIRLLHSAKPQENKEEKQPKKQSAQKDGLLSKDKTLITSIRKSKRGAEFKNLYSGAAGKSEKSEKQLLTILNFFSNSDAEQIQRIFKSSSIYDPTKGQEHLTDMVTGVIKRSRDFTNSMKATNANGKQAGNNAAKNSSKGAGK